MNELAAIWLLRTEKRFSEKTRWFTRCTVTRRFCLLAFGRDKAGNLLVIMMATQGVSVVAGSQVVNPGSGQAEAGKAVLLKQSKN